MDAGQRVALAVIGLVVLEPQLCGLSLVVVRQRIVVNERQRLCPRQQQYLRSACVPSSRLNRLAKPDLVGLIRGGRCFGR